MPRLELRDIVKRFGRLTALDGVSLTLERGRVHGVLGENGAGKSTLMNVLYGLIRPDGGHILADGTELLIRSPRGAIEAGIGMVHQHFMLAGALSVLDNVLLGDMRQALLLDRAGAAHRLLELSQRIGLPVDPDARVADLSVGQQQRVEILKALWRNVDVLILDEPTAVLTPGETDQLLSAMTRLRQEGKTVIFISHKLAEVQRICDEITVLRRGKVTWHGPARDATAYELAEHMIGHAMEEAVASPEAPLPDPPALLLQELRAAGLSAINLRVPRAGIVGIAGVDGNGQQELAEAVVGLRKTTGQITLDGHDISSLNASDRAALGIAYVPNDRKRDGLIGSMQLTRNIALKHHRHKPFSRAGIMSWRSARSLAAELMARYDIRANSPDDLVGSLSGGNAQKVVLARELAVKPPRLLVAINPTRGLDVAATRFVHDELLRQRDAGCGILLISSELEELTRLCGRITVLYRGKLTETRFPEGGAEQIGRLMSGVA